MKMNCFVFCHHPATRPPFIRHYILWHNFQTFFSPWTFSSIFDNFIWCQNVQTFLSFNFQYKDFWVKLNPAAQLFKAPEEIANSLKSNQRKSLHPSTDIFILSFWKKIKANQNGLQFDHHVGMHPTSYCWFVNAKPIWRVRISLVPGICDSLGKLTKLSFSWRCSEADICIGLPIPIKALSMITRTDSSNMSSREKYWSRLTSSHGFELN